MSFPMGFLFTCLFHWVFLSVMFKCNNINFVQMTSNLHHVRIDMILIVYPLVFMIYNDFRSYYALDMFETFRQTCRRSSRCGQFRRNNILCYEWHEDWQLTRRREKKCSIKLGGPTKEKRKVDKRLEERTITSRHEFGRMAESMITQDIHMRPRRKMEKKIKIKIKRKKREKKSSKREKMILDRFGQVWSH